MWPLSIRNAVRSEDKQTIAWNITVLLECPGLGNINSDKTAVNLDWSDSMPTVQGFKWNAHWNQQFYVESASMRICLTLVLSFALSCHLFPKWRPQGYCKRFWSALGYTRGHYVNYQPKQCTLIRKITENWKLSYICIVSSLQKG